MDNQDTLSHFYFAIVAIIVAAVIVCISTVTSYSIGITLEV